MGRAARSEAGIKVRQPLARLLVKVNSKWQQQALQRLAAQILEEVNVKGMEVVAALPAKDWPSVSEGDLTVMLDTDISPELEAEGTAREVVRRLQTMRRAAGFDIADHIMAYYRGDAYVERVMADFTDYIKQETLSEQLVAGIPGAGVFTESHKLGGREISLGVKRLT